MDNNIKDWMEKSSIEAGKMAEEINKNPQRRKEFEFLKDTMFNLQQELMKSLNEHYKNEEGYPLRIYLTIVNSFFAMLNSMAIANADNKKEAFYIIGEFNKFISKAHPQINEQYFEMWGNKEDESCEKK